MNYGVFQCFATCKSSTLVRIIISCTLTTFCSTHHNCAVSQDVNAPVREELGRPANVTTGSSSAFPSSQTNLTVKPHKQQTHRSAPALFFHTFNPLKLPGLVGEELEDFVDLGVESWLLGVPFTGPGNNEGDSHQNSKQPDCGNTKHMHKMAPMKLCFI